MMEEGRCVRGVAKVIESVPAQKQHPYHNLECCLHSPLFHLASFFAPARLCRLLQKGRKKESKEYKLKKLIFNIMIKINWTTIVKVLKFLATVITSVAGTLAVQSCAPHWF